MDAPYSQDLRDRVLAAADRGMTTWQIADVFCVSASWVRRVKQRRREFGETTPRKMGSPGICKIDRAKLADQLWNAMQSVLDRITPSDATNRFIYCIYSL